MNLQQDVTEKIRKKQQLLSLPLPYVKFLIGLFISRLGDSLYTFAIPWVAYHLTGSVVVMGSLFVMTVLPVVLFGPFVGVAVDRWDKRLIMLFVDAGRLLLVSCIPLFHWMGILHLWHLYTICFMLAVLTLFFDVAAVSSIPGLVDKELTKANSLYQFVNQLAEVIGPILSGVIVAAIGGFNSLWIDAGSFFIIMMFVYSLPIMRPKSETLKRSVFKEMTFGFRWLRKDHLNLSLSVQAAVGNLGASAVLAVFMYYLISELHLNSQQSGFNYMLIGVGGIIGSVLVVPMQRKVRRGKLIPLLLGVGALGLLLVYASDYWLIPGLAFGLTTLCNTGWNVIVSTVRHETVPQELLGRVLGFSRVLSRLGMPFGAFAGTFIAEKSIGMVFLFAAATKAIEVILALVTPIKRL